MRARSRRWMATADPRTRTMNAPRFNASPRAYLPRTHASAAPSIAPGSRGAFAGSATRRTRCCRQRYSVRRGRCHPRGPRRELPMPNRRKTDADEPAFRRLIDDVATADESARARAAIRAALQHEDGQGCALIGRLRGGAQPAGAAFVQALAFAGDRRAPRGRDDHRRDVATGRAPRELSLRRWRRSELRPSSGPFAPHCDRANRDSYDVSALLYLSTAGEHFSGGGEFAFNDDDRGSCRPREDRVPDSCSSELRDAPGAADGGWRGIYGERVVYQVYVELSDGRTTLHNIAFALLRQPPATAASAHGGRVKPH